MFDVVVTGGTVVSPSGEVPADIGIRGGSIAAIAAPGTLGGAREVIDANGLHVLPGLIDPHVHLREPGYTHKEDFRSGTMAAAAGGVTTVMAIPNTNPPLTTPEAFQSAVELAGAKATVDFAIFAGACMGNPAGIAALADSGAIGFDLYDNPFDYGLAHWIELFRQVRGTGRPLIFYAFQNALVDLNRTELDARGAPAVERFAAPTTGTAEMAGMAHIIPLAVHFGVPVVLRAVTTAQGLEFVRLMRRSYPEARCAVETCVHYLFLTLDDLRAMGTRAQMLPPLRPPSDVDALWQAVRGRLVDYIGTDHAPHAPAEKAGGDILQSPPGIIGLETLLPLMLNARAQGQLDFADVVRLCCEGPARTYGIFPRKGAIAVGADADLVLVDASERWRIDASRFYSRGDRGPFHGREISGRPRRTLVRGETVMLDGKVEANAVGRLVTPERRECHG